MVKLEFVLSPDEADLVMRALDRAREMEHREQQDVSAETSEESSEAASWPSRADGIVALAESYLAGNVASGHGGERFQVTVHVDQDPLAADGALAATLEDGTNVSAETLRRVACDCGLVAVNSARESLNIGRRTRSTARHSPSAAVTRPRLRFPRLHTRPIPARSPCEALAARG